MIYIDLNKLNEGGKIMNLLADVVAEVATAVAAPGSTECALFGFDEPECPQEIL